MSIVEFFYSGWRSPLRVVIVGICAYVSLLILLRISGKRTLSKMNAFDFIVTIALGSTLASALLSRDAAWLDAVTAFALLIALQYVVTWLSVRSPWLNRLVKSEPALLLYRGQFLPDAMRHERVAEEEVLAALREHGVTSASDALAVVLETAGTLSVVRATDDAPADVLRTVRRAPQNPERQGKR